MSWDQALAVRICLSRLGVALIPYVAPASIVTGICIVPFVWWNDINARIRMIQWLWGAGLDPRQHRHFFRNWSAWTRFGLK